jgi:hypothetical protein
VRAPLMRDLPRGGSVSATGSLAAQIRDARDKSLEMIHEASDHKLDALFGGERGPLDIPHVISTAASSPKRRDACASGLAVLDQESEAAVLV